MLRRLLVLLSAVWLVGCGTAISKTAGNDWGRYYSGVACDWRFVSAWLEDPSRGEAPFVAAAVIDLPLSLVADTVVAPVDFFLDEGKEATSCFEVA